MNIPDSFYENRILFAYIFWKTNFYKLKLRNNPWKDLTVINLNLHNYNLSILFFMK